MAQFEKLVAIKRILPHLSDNKDFVTMFIDEGKIAAQLTHQNIAQIYELGEEQGYYYIAMEYVHGKDLKSLMALACRREYNVSIEHAVSIISKLCSGLDYAHRKKDLSGRDLNIVHRDISPQNVLISYEGEVKIIDFGIAKAAAKDHHTRAGALKGKILYMSPEQASGRTIDKRSDIFSLGTLLYEMLTQQRLFLASTEIQILKNVREANVPHPNKFNPSIPEQLNSIILKALAKDPKNRYQSAAEMKNDLDVFFYSGSIIRGKTDLATFLTRLDDLDTEVSTKNTWSQASTDVHYDSSAEIQDNEDTVASRPEAKRGVRKTPISDEEWDDSEIDRLLAEAESGFSLSSYMSSPLFYIIVVFVILMIAIIILGDKIIPF